MPKPEQAQATQAATPEPASEADVKKPSQQEPKAEEAKPEGPFKVFQTQEEYDTAIKSEASKAKNDWLKENNLKSVDEYRANMAKYEEAVKAKESQDKFIKDLQSQLEKSHEEILARDLGVSPEHKDDLMILAKAKVGKDVTLEQAAKSILDSTPSWKGIIPQPRIGTEQRAPAADNKNPQANRDLMREFPWLK
jgi:hypothetical protein